MKIILGSSSISRQRLLDKLQIPYEIQAPNVDETPLPNESAADLVQRLALLKAQMVAKDYPDDLIISSDQVADFNGNIIGKPKDRADAVAQLSAFSDKKAIFYNGLCVFRPKFERHHLSLEPVSVKFRPLTAAQIDAYIDKAQPFNCAGSFDVEGLGITLFESVNSTDPNTLVGLPLIQLITLLKSENIDVLTHEGLL